MRAVFYPDLILQEEYQLSGDMLHHLLNVVRIEKDEQVLLLNGQGFGVQTIVSEIAKKSLRLKKSGQVNSKRSYEMDLALAIPKKDALDLSLKEATELGFSRVFLVKGELSQTKLPERERIHSLLVSALEQSNAFFLPDVTQESWESLPWNDYGTVLLLDSQTGDSSPATHQTGRALLIVGAEGGFSSRELLYLRGKSQVESLFLPTPILRAPTAVATGAGILLQRLML